LTITTALVVNSLGWAISIVAELDCIGLCSGFSKGGRPLESKGKRLKSDLANHQSFCLRLAALSPIFQPV
jgi:hypothetical protein